MNSNSSVGNNHASVNHPISGAHTNRSLQRWLMRIWAAGIHALLRKDNPQIRYYQNGSGDAWWRVYDPVTGRSAYCSSENDVRIWLDRRY